MAAYFGPAGNSESFAAMGYKSSLDVPEYIKKMGLDCFEYQCGRGVNISEDKARKLGELCRDAGIRLSIHAPYYISLAAAEEAKRDNSINYILQSARAADWMGATRIVVHPGGKGKFDREYAMELAADTFARAVRALDEHGLGHVSICPETMGKINQLGTLEEIVRLCQIDERVVPCIDFGHLNARTHGDMNSRERFAAVLDMLENKLGSERAKTFHSHFSKIEYSEGGEVRHLTFTDELYGPGFAPLAELIVERGCSPTFICESAGTQAEDAAAMKAMYQAAGGERI